MTSFAGHTADIFSVVSSSDHKCIFSSGVEKYVFIWDVSNRRILRRLSGHGGPINVLSLFPHSDEILVSGSFDATRSYLGFTVLTAGSSSNFGARQRTPSPPLARVIPPSLRGYPPLCTLMIIRSADGYIRKIRHQKGAIGSIQDLL